MLTVKEVRGITHLRGRVEIRLASVTGRIKQHKEGKERGAKAKERSTCLQVFQGVR